jgi:hypothetical protein
MKRWLGHQLSHLALGVLLFLAGVVFQKLHEYHHREADKI